MPRFSAVSAVIAACVLAACATARPPAVKAPPDEGKPLYAAKCQGCHRLYPPEAIDHLKWPALLDRMALKAKLTPEEKERIGAYVTSAEHRP